MAPGRTSGMPRTTGRTRRTSSSSLTGSEPGRVDSPPTSTIRAPSSSIVSACTTAASTPKNSPPSEKESGVTLRMPIRIGSRPVTRLPTLAFSRAVGRRPIPLIQVVVVPAVTAGVRNRTVGRHLVHGVLLDEAHQEVLGGVVGLVDDPADLLVDLKGNLV